MNKHQKFLEFNGKTIIFVSAEGTSWIVVKSICEALEVDTDRCIKNIKKDSILSTYTSIQAVLVEKNGKSQMRNMTCISENFIYGWIFSIRSASKELNDYKLTCYKLLFSYFHGSVTVRKELLVERAEIDEEINKLKEAMKLENKQYALLRELELKRKMLSTQINVTDKDLLNQPELFSNIDDETDIEPEND